MKPTIQLTLSLALLMGLMAGCIDNDIPYPKLAGDITAIEFEGSTAPATIDAAARTVTVNMADTVDMTKVKINNLEVTNHSTVTPSIASTVDLSQILYLTLTTRQSYIWKIEATQKIARTMAVTNQVGESVIDVGNRRVLANVVMSQSLSEITIKSLVLGPSNSTITPDPATVHDFRSPQTFTVKYSGHTEQWVVRVLHSDASISTGEVNAWAKFAYVEGSYVDGMGSPAFEYRAKGTDTWSRLTEGLTIVNTKFSGKITGLTPATQYELRSVAGDNVSAIVTFTTESTEDIPNLNFDSWCKIGKSWYANSDLSDANYWWDSGNKGTNALGEKNPTAPETEVVVKGKAVKMASTKVLSVFAAGSIYLGQFGKVVGLGAEIYMGRPYTARPTTLKGYYNYTSGTIDKTKSPYEAMEGKPDSCHIYIALTDADAPHTVNTTDKVFIDLDKDPYIIALGQLKTSETTNGYKPFTITLQYRSLTRKPKYMLLVAAASKLGDYFTGSTSSVLYIDEFELGYD